MYVTFGQSQSEKKEKKETNWAPNLAIIGRKLGKQTFSHLGSQPCFRGLQGTTHTSKYGELFSSLFFFFASLLVQLSRSVMSPDLRKDWIRRGEKIKRENYKNHESPFLCFFSFCFWILRKDCRFIVASFELRRGEERGEGEGEGGGLFFCFCP